VSLWGDIQALKVDERTEVRFVLRFGVGKNATLRRAGSTGVTSKANSYAWPKGLASAAITAIVVMISAPVDLRAQETEVVETAEEQSSFEALINEAKSNMMADPQAALSLAEDAQFVVDSPDVADRDMALATVWWLQSEALTRLGRPLDARPIAEQALARFPVDAEPSKLYADVLVSLGRINKLTGEYGLALENFFAAYDVFQAIGETRSESIVLQSIASIYKAAHQYERAVGYYADAAERYQGDLSLELAARNNLGNVLRELGRYDEALTNFERAREIAVEMESPLLEARILNNLGSLHVTFGNHIDADASIDAAFTLIDPAATEWSRFLWGVRAQAAYERGQYSSARDHIQRTFDGVSTRETTQHFTEFHEAAANIYQALGNYDAAVPHLLAFKRLDDEAREVAASANSTLLAAQFEFAEQGLQIEQLRAQGLEQDLALSNARARQRLLASSAVTLLSILAIIGILLRSRGVRERQKALERALYEDADTGLPSRPAAERVIELGRAETTNSYAAVALGIERYKHLEGALGFVKIAELKRAMVERLEENVDAEAVALFSPSVLGVVLKTADLDVAKKEAERARRCFLSPLQIDGVDIDVAVTGGVAAATDGELGVRNAIIALEQAREQNLMTGIYDEKLFGDPAKNLALMSRMLGATRNGHMSLHYQPKLHLASGTYRAAEALSRWDDPERGPISPVEFIPLAEETGHIRDFTEWTLEQVIRDQATLRAAGHSLSVAVNISGALISDADFAERALRIAKSAPEPISFEITETAAMEHPERAMANLQKWREAGIKLAIDDYGSGLSSLAYLRNLPSHELKLDRAFISNIETSHKDRLLVRSTADLAHALGLELTAEGVETEAGLAVLKMFGCDWAQGYVLAKPQPLASLIEFLDANNNTAETIPRLPRAGNDGA
jgi:EAL domain-containing protein (putative c-di-GMP-specific phosphodiesterase class I)/Tfp pilus assembly protein PilF